MTYYINPIWFYLMSIGSTLRIALFSLCGTLLTIAIIGLVFIIMINDDDAKEVFKKLKKIAIISSIGVAIGIIIPSKEATIEIIVANQITYENVNATKEELYNLIDYITDKVGE